MIRHKTHLFQTARAASQITKILAQQAKPHFGLRIAIQRGGCSGLWGEIYVPIKFSVTFSGLNYKLDLVEKAEPGDEIIEMFGAKVAVDPKSAVFVTGSEIDYVSVNTNVFHKASLIFRLQMIIIQCWKCYINQLSLGVTYVIWY